MNDNYNYKKPSFLHPDGNSFQTVEGFNFTRNDFEDLIDNFTDEDTILILLQITRPELDKFCNEVYHMNYKETYEVLYQRAQLYYRKAMMMLSKSGNPSAIKVASEYFAKLGGVNTDDNKITFVGVMPVSQSDVELLQKQHQTDKEAVDKFKKEEGID